MRGNHNHTGMLVRAAYGNGATTGATCARNQMHAIGTTIFAVPVFVRPWLELCTG